MGDAQSTEEKTVIGRQTKVSLEVLGTLVVLTAGLVASFIRAEMNNAATRSDLVSLQAQFSLFAETTSTELQNANGTLSEMLAETRLRNKLETIRIGDRWTATMQEEYHRLLLSLFKQVHPEVDASSFPGVKDLQKKYLDRIYELESILD